MRALCTTLAALALAGCATTSYVDTPKPFHWTAPNGKSYMVSGEFRRQYENNEFTGGQTGQATFHLLMNGREVAAGGIHPYSFSGNYAGQVDDMAISATCHSVQGRGNTRDVTCDIAADGKPIGALTL